MVEDVELYVTSCHLYDSGFRSKIYLLSDVLLSCYVGVIVCRIVMITDLVALTSTHPRECSWKILKITLNRLFLKETKL